MGIVNAIARSELISSVQSMSLLTQTEVHDQIIQAEAAPQRLAVATIITTSGSTPQRTGAKLLVFEDGRMLGTVGGGCVEADVWAEAREALHDGQARLCHFTLRDNPDVPPDEEGMICGGEMEVLIEVWGHPSSPSASVATAEFAATLPATTTAGVLHRALAAGRPACLVAVIPSQGERPELRPTPRRLLVEAPGPDSNSTVTVVGTLGDPQLDLLASEQARLFMTDDRLEITVAGSPELVLPDGMRLLFEISRPPLEMIICGGGHVGQAVARAARLLDFKITVIDDRPEFASRDKFPDPEVRLIADDFIAALQSLRFTPATHVVIVTRGHRHDEICLREVIDRPVRYLGMIGSRRRTTTIREHLRRQGVEPELLRRIHAPIGLDISALTPEEIAIAIVAEIILVRRGGTGAPKSADGPMAKAR